MRRRNPLHTDTDIHLGDRVCESTLMSWRSLERHQLEHAQFKSALPCQWLESSQALVFICWTLGLRPLIHVPTKTAFPFPVRNQSAKYLLPQEDKASLNSEEPRNFLSKPEGPTAHCVWPVCYNEEDRHTGESRRAHLTISMEENVR